MDKELILSLIDAGGLVLAVFILWRIVHFFIQTTATTFLPEISQMYKTASETQAQAVKGLQTSVERRETHLTELNKKIETLQARIDALELQVTQRDKRIEGLELQILSLTGQIEDMGKQIVSLTEQNTTLRAEAKTSE